MALNKMREDIVNAFLDSLSQNILPWEREWNLKSIPINSQGKPYKGVNRLWLSLAAFNNNFKDNRWMTFKQATSKGYKIKKGESGTRIEFWSMYDVIGKKKITITEAANLIKRNPLDWEDRLRPISSVYTVFNAEQIEGIPKLEDNGLVVAEDILAGRDRLIREMGVDFVEGGDTACYFPEMDKIRMPYVSSFKNEYGYMATFLHEAAHATGAFHRLNRNIQNRFGTEDYAKEELRAEIASAFTSQTLCINGTKMQNHTAYVKNWINILKNEPNELFAAIKDAEKISDYLLIKGGFIQDLSMEYKGDKENFIDKVELSADMGEPISAEKRAIYNQCIIERYNDTSLEDIVAKVKAKLGDNSSKNLSKDNYERM